MFSVSSGLLNGVSSDKSDDTLMTQSAAEDATLSPPNVTNDVQNKRPEAWNKKKATNGFMMLFWHVDILGFHAVATQMSRLDKPLTF